MCRGLVSCANFKAILTPSSQVTVSNNFTKRRQDNGTRDKLATHLESVYLTKKGQSDIVYISPDSCHSRILNSINKRNPTAFAIAEVTESELEDDNMGLEQFLDSVFDGVDGGHEASAVLPFPEGIAEIRSHRERGVRKRNLDDMAYY